MANSTQSNSHPYYPIDAELIGYLANEWSVPFLISIFAGGWAFILGSTLVVLSFVTPKLGKADRVAILWFMLTGSIHLFFEGYFVVNHTRMAPAQDFFGQLWKEYSLSDSRYLTSDPFVLCMETITAILWGPLSFIVVYFIAREHPLRHPLQLIVSIGQIYGDVLYYATSMFDHYYNGLSYCRPEAYYFWCYYFFMNLIWIVIPSYYVVKSMGVMSHAIKYVNEASDKRKIK
ncbi:EBP domain-containing protein [Histoplasma capsulatum]|uniref:EBP domain-containing protein n=1 Tax=Ajellomyces capsulatus TaxID=5037 RepID=A0A8A1M6I3_AJECA|nr:EBP domain-containing protein [Histoplasma capsulatum]